MADGIERVTPVICDLNGIYRGKRAPHKDVHKILNGEMKLPLSTLFLDIWGRDVLQSGLVLEAGDGDGTLYPAVGGALRQSWCSVGGALIPLSMYEQNGEPCDADPRHALQSVVDAFREDGLTPVCAMEAEFYLYRLRGDDTDCVIKGAAPFPRAHTEEFLPQNDLYAIHRLDEVQPIFDDLAVACEKMDIPLGAVVSEGGAGQFEVNLEHRADAVRAADDMQLVKTAIRGVAAKHGLGATFMAKPYGEEAGNGMHAHISVVDADGRNIFDDGTPKGSDALISAIGGLQATLLPSMLIFAPHANSYRRLRPETHAPTTASWGYDNRTTALRIPSGPSQARRIEHRVAGADANPYLALAAILGGIRHGLANRSVPDAPSQGNAYAQSEGVFVTNWLQSIIDFEEASFVSEIFSKRLIKAFTACKRQELDTLASIVSREEIDTYLSVV